MDRGDENKAVPCVPGCSAGRWVKAQKLDEQRDWLPVIRPRRRAAYGLHACAGMKLGNPVSLIRVGIGTKAAVKRYGSHEKYLKSSSMRSSMADVRKPSSWRERDCSIEAPPPNPSSHEAPGSGHYPGNASRPCESFINESGLRYACELNSIPVP